MLSALRDRLATGLKQMPNRSEDDLTHPSRPRRRSSPGLTDPPKNCTEWPHRLIADHSRAPGQMHAATADFDEEQHVQPLKRHRIDGEEVYGKDALPLGTQELTPRQSAASAGWAELFLAQNLLHRGRRHHDANARAETSAMTSDDSALDAGRGLSRCARLSIVRPDARNSREHPGSACNPTWVLLGHPQHKLPNLGQDTTRACSLPRMRPLARHQPPVPSQKRVRRDSRRNLAQRRSTQSVRSPGQSSPVIICEPQAPLTDLPPKNAILFHQIGECLALPAIEPTGNGQEQQAKHG